MGSFEKSLVSNPSSFIRWNTRVLVLISVAGWETFAFPKNNDLTFHTYFVLSEWVMAVFVKKCPCLRPKIEEDVRTLDYRHCSLHDVPGEVFNFERTLEELLVDSNQIQDLPRVSWIVVIVIIKCHLQMSHDKFRFACCQGVKLFDIGTLLSNIEVESFLVHCNRCYVWRCQKNVMLFQCQKLMDRVVC